jgi:hypothetical protein
MGVGAIFLLLLVLIVVALACFGIYALTMSLRHRQLDPDEDRVEGPGRNGQEPERRRPEHLEVESEQRSRFVGHR